MAESKPKASGRSKGSSAGKRASTKSKPKAAAKSPAKKSAAKSSTKTAAPAKPPPSKAGADKPAPDLPARIDGLRGWLDQIERRQGRMTYFAAAGLLIALAASGVALYLGISAHQDSATKSSLDDVKAEIGKVRTDTAASADQKLKALNATIAALQQRVTAAEQQAQQAQKTAAAKSTAIAPPFVTPAPTTTTPNNNKNGKTGGSNP